MADTVRSLVAKLSFETDTTGADKFAKKFKGLTQGLSKGSDKFKAFEKDYNNSLKRMQKRNDLFKASLATLGFAVGAFAVTSSKAFLTLEDKKTTLESSVGAKNFSKIQSSIDKSRSEVGSFTEDQVLGIVSHLVDTFGKDRLDKSLKILPNILKIAATRPSIDPLTVAQGLTSGAKGDQGDLVKNLGISDVDKERTLSVLGIRIARTINAQLTQLAAIADNPIFQDRFKEVQKKGSFKVNELKVQANDFVLESGEEISNTGVGFLQLFQGKFKEGLSTLNKGEENNAQKLSRFFSQTPTKIASDLNKIIGGGTASKPSQVNGVTIVDQSKITVNKDGTVSKKSEFKVLTTEDIKKAAEDATKATNDNSIQATKPPNP
jgi:hypothetical protein